MYTHPKALCINILIWTIALSCSGPSKSESEIVTDLLWRKAGLYLNDSIVHVTEDDNGFDLHGSWSTTYSATISENDVIHVINQIRQNSTNEWTETDSGDYVMAIYPHDLDDTTFQIGILKSKSVILVTMNQGF